LSVGRDEVQKAVKSYKLVLMEIKFIIIVPFRVLKRKILMRFTSSQFRFKENKIWLNRN